MSSEKRETFASMLRLASATAVGFTGVIAGLDSAAMPNVYNARVTFGGTLMKTMASRVVLMALAIFLIFGWHAYRSQTAVEAQERAAVKATRLYSGTDGLSHLEQVDVKFFPVTGAPATAEESEHVKTTKSYVVRLAPGFFEDWHNADVRRYVVPISGRAVIEVAGGEKISVEPGRIYLAEDLTGKGHTFRVAGSNDWVALFVDFAQ
jgi:hypothetical protein